MTTPKWLHSDSMSLPDNSMKTVKCRECGVDVPVNANYPITSVDCHKHYCPKDKAELDTPSY